MFTKERTEGWRWRSVNCRLETEGFLFKGLKYIYLSVFSYYESEHICLYGNRSRDEKLLPKVKEKRRTLPWKNIVAVLSREDVQNWAQKDLKTGK